MNQLPPLPNQHSWTDRDFYSLLERLPQTVTQVDAQGHILWANRAALETFKYTWEDLEAGLTVLQMVDPRDHQRILKGFEEAVINSSPHQEEYVGIDQQGNTFPMLVNTNPYYGEGIFLGYVAIITDLTDYKATEREIQRIQKLEALSLLAGGVAHDFNNILTAIMGNLNLCLLDLPQDSHLREPLIQVEKATLRAKDLTRQLSSFSRGGAPVKTTCNLASIILDSAQFVLHGSKSILSHFIPMDLWPAVVDEGQISQVIQNLVLNASQAMPEGGEVNISARNFWKSDSSASTPWVEILVHDQGGGISTDLKNRIFDPYFTTKKEGSGLGLSIVHTIMSTHGGSISLESQEGCGTTFVLQLPAQPGALSLRPNHNPGLFKGRGRILVMDDDKDSQGVVVKLLEKLGFTTLGVNTGQEAVDAYLKNPRDESNFDLILLDLTIPGGMGGLETFLKIKNINPEVKAVLTSGYCEDPVLQNYQDFGFLGALKKPFVLQSLIDLLDLAGLSVKVPGTCEEKL